MSLLKRGSRGNDVVTLQRCLGLPQDGIFGPDTERGVINFQKKNGLKPDGIVGKMTWEKLMQSGTKEGAKGNMRINQRGIDLIKHFEGLRTKAYKCPAGKWTIGYGHISGVKEGMVISEQQADQFLRDDIKRFEGHVNKYHAKYNFNENQFSALVCFAFNIGNIDQLTQNGTRSINEIKKMIPAYNKSGGKVLEGLSKRRNAEVQLFSS